MNKKIYKGLVILLICLVVIVVISILVARNRDNVLNNRDVYTGFLQIEKGAWSEFISIDSNDNENLQRLVYLGEKTIEGIPSYGIEMESNLFNGKNALTHVWLNKESNEIVEMISKLEEKNKIVCIDGPLVKILMPSFDSLIPTVETPAKYNPSNEYIYGIFTTKDGKTIQVAKFVDENDLETWISSEVPFGIIKAVNNKTGRVISSLKDFGLSGARQKISQSDITDCEKIGFPDLSDFVE